MKTFPGERAALTWLCEHLPELRLEIGKQDAGQAHILGAVEADARARRPIRRRLESLLVIQEEGQDRGGSHQLPGLGPGGADEEVFRCADGACDRIATAVPAGPAPRCLLTGERMARRES
jgi:hypothetical protein